MALLEIRNLEMGYRESKGKYVVGTGLNAKLNKGEMACLLGANGKGKSTLLKSMCKFIPLLDGNIFIQGHPIAEISEVEMSKQVSVVLTDRLSLPNATVHELVGYGRSPYTGFMGRLSKRDEAIIDRAMEQCGIAHKQHYLLSSLSDGERQKASIAKALAQETPVILLDEPTAFLDLPSRVEIMKLLRELASQSEAAILMSTHDLDLALQMADKLWLLHSDKLVSGSPEDLLLENAFQPMFNKESITFDNRTGLFRVEYKHEQELQVKGHGFEYVLLRRAFARKGIKLTNLINEEDLWLKIDKDSEKPFCLIDGSSIVAKESSVEKIVNHSVKHLSAPMHVAQNNKELLHQSIVE